MRTKLINSYEIINPMRYKTMSRFLKTTLLLTLVLMTTVVSGQVAINEDNSDADPKTALDIKSTTKGVLFPNLSETQRNNLPSPATGLLIFNRTVGYFNYYNGYNWCRLERQIVLNPSVNPIGAGTDVGVGIGISDPDNSAILHVNANNKGVLFPKLNSDIPDAAEGMFYFNTINNNIRYFDGSNWIILTRSEQSLAASGVGTAEGVVIGGTTVDASAKLEIKPTGSQGLLIPRMTTAERNNIVSPAEGLLIYNISLHQPEFFVDNAWYTFKPHDPEYGTIITKPGLSCREIIENNASAAGVNGTYYINPAGTGAYECYCDMTTDGGGWTLVINTGPKGNNNTNTGTVGSSLILPTQLTFAKLSDTHINLIRGGSTNYATSILRVQKPKACNTNTIYFKQNRVLNSNAANNTQSIRTYHISYANAITNTNLQTGTSNYGSAFDSWTGGTAGYRIIFSYGGEGFIYDGCNSVHPDCTANNRSVCNVLVWVK